ncbi:MAG: ABC transporter permease subunit [Chloroflexi bacterium]|nr:ABC transporter permease subunit [Chloroflexota bacterium]
MLSNIYLKTLRDSRKSVLFYSIGSISLGLYVTLFYPTIRDATGFAEFLDQLPEVMQSLIGDAETYTTAEGFLNAELFSFMGPLVIGIFAIIAGMTAIAGEEESHTLDQLMANPISRTNLLAQKIGALLTNLMFLSIAMWVGLTGGSILAGFDLSISGTTQAIISQYALGAVLGLLALSVGASTGKKGLAGGVAAGVGLVGFLLDTFLSLVDLLNPARFISVFYYFNSNDVILHGINVVHFLTLVAIAVTAIAISLWRFERRDLAN